MSQEATFHNDPAEIRATLERVRSGELTAYRELFESYVEKIHVVLCQVIPRQEFVHPLERQVFIDIWDRRIELIEGVHVDSWIQRKTVDSIKYHYLKGRRIGVRKRQAFLERLDTLLSSSLDGTLTPDECPIAIEMRRSLWNEVQAYIETQPEGAEPWNFPGVLMWMVMMLLLFVGFLYAAFNFSIDLTPPEPPHQPSAATIDATIPESPSQEVAVAPALRGEKVPEPAVISAGLSGDGIAESLEGNEELLLLHNEYQALKSEFIESIDVDDSVHDSELQETVEEDLDIVEQSISELVGLLGDDPENQFLEDMLIKTYKKQVKLLRKVSFLNE